MKFLKDYWVTIVIGIVLVIAAIFSFKDKPESAETGQEPETTMESNQPASSASGSGTSISSPTTGQPSASGSVWEGTLMASDNAAKGNLMIKVQDHVIYLRTSRDYSSLIGKEVRVSYQGTLENFSLDDITAK